MNKFLNIPNILTLSRICLLPFFVGCFFINSKSGLTLSLIIFVFCCITDYFDGYYARAFKQTTKIGQMLDPLADKILVSITILLIVGLRLVSTYTIIPAAIILCREIIISGVRDATEFSGKNFKTSYLSKCKTATQMISLALIILSNILDLDILLKIGEAMFWGAAIIAVISGFIYCKTHLFAKSS